MVQHLILQVVHESMYDAAVRAPCVIDDCSSPSAARGWCRKHYYRWKKHGDPLAWNPRRQSIDERFWSKVDKDGPVPDYAPHLGQCWIWTDSPNRGYGRLFIAKRPRQAHRLSYEMTIGPIAEGMDLDHLCRVTVCVNPAHLEPVTHQINILRGEAPPAHAARKLTCPKGHPYDLSNTWVSPSTGWRVCRTCQSARRPARRRAAAAG